QRYACFFWYDPARSAKKGFDLRQERAGVGAAWLLAKHAVEERPGFGEAAVERIGPGEVVEGLRVGAVEGDGALEVDDGRGPVARLQQQAAEQALGLRGGLPGDGRFEVRRGLAVAP